MLSELAQLIAWEDSSPKWFIIMCGLAFSSIAQFVGCEKRHPANTTQQSLDV